MGVTLAAGYSLRWFRDQLCHIRRDGIDPYDVLTDEASRVPPGAEGLLWTPYLMGERTPHLDPHIRGALVGLAAHHGRGHIVRAVLEGVAFSLRDTFTIFSELQIPVERIRLGGGGARSPLWRQIQANVYGHAVETVAADEGAAFGAAVLAGVGARIWSSVDEACDALVQTGTRTPAEPDIVKAMNAQYELYRRVYPALRGIRSTKEPNVGLHTAS
jgi:xylulokinase